MEFGTLQYFLYLAAALTILVYAFRKEAITPDGMVAALLTAVTLYTLGGFLLGSSLILFFILGTGVSKMKTTEKHEAEKTQEHTGARNWKQVLANSLPAVILSWIYFFTEEPIYLFLAFTVFSAAASDTFSSEIGMMSKGKVYHILTGKPLPMGVSGGVTLQGLVAGIVGSVLLSLPILLAFGAEEYLLGVLLGFFGTIIDSVLGASLQRKYEDVSGKLQDIPAHAMDLPKKGFRLVSNNAVNLLSLTLVAIVGYVVTTL